MYTLEYLGVAAELSSLQMQYMVEGDLQSFRRIWETKSKIGIRDLIVLYWNYLSVENRKHKHISSMDLVLSLYGE